MLPVGATAAVYGPFDDGKAAGRFAAFMTAEVDPATVVKLSSPTLELLAFYENPIDPEVPS